MIIRTYIQLMCTLLLIDDNFSNNKTNLFSIVFIMTNIQKNGELQKVYDSFIHS